MRMRLPAAALAAAIITVAGTLSGADRIHAQAVNAAAAAHTDDTNVVEITAIEYAFQAPDAIPSGWTTIRFVNDGEEPHFVFLSRLPEGKTVDDYERDLSGPFSRAWYAVRDDGATEEAALEGLFAALPEWFAQVQFVGGPGITAPGTTSDMTMRLAPGNYVIECYLKTEEGEIHYMDGMIRPLVVSEARSAMSPPAADIRVTLSNFKVDMEGDITPGRHTVAIHVAENPEVGFGHSAHLARLAHDTDVDDVVKWMNWFGRTGLSAPAPVHFIGGMHAMAAGETAYLTVDLEPGRYLWISQDTGAQGVFREFTVR